MKTVFTVGVYDLIHFGHVELFRKARALGDRLVVAVQDSDWITRFKPDSPAVNSTEMRMYMVGAIRYVDEVISYQDVASIVKQVPFDIFVAGGDQKHSGFLEAIEWCKAHGKTVVRLPRTEGISTSELKEHIRSANKA